MSTQTEVNAGGATLSSNPQTLLLTCRSKDILKSLVPEARIQICNRRREADVEIEAPWLSSYHGFDNDYEVEVQYADLPTYATFWWLYIPQTGITIHLQNSLFLSIGHLFKEITSEFRFTDEINSQSDDSEGSELDCAVDSSRYYDISEVTEKLQSLAKGGWRDDWPKGYHKVAVKFINKIFWSDAGGDRYSLLRFRRGALSDDDRKKLEDLKDDFNRTTPPKRTGAEEHGHHLRPRKRHRKKADNKMVQSSRDAKRRKLV